ncbi:MAG: hypothetical protein JXP73_13225 [Deltaproteobacteria bacterium]|jgi:hypothetical protein|nr:hypothetical protein [Deltaproteobacteria bacterium]
MHRRHCTLACALALVFSLGLGLSAARADDASDGHPLLEEPRSRQGYWIGFGATGIAAQLWENGKDRGIYGGWTGTFRIGQLITKRLGLGLLVEYFDYAGGISKGSDAGTTGGITIEGSCLLWRDLSVHTGFGIGYVLVKDPNAIDDSYRGGGGSYLLLGASYDIFPLKKKLTGGWALTPIVDLHVMPQGNIKFMSLMAGLQITWWSGLPDNMLRLSEE